MTIPNNSAEAQLPPLSGSALVRAAKKAQRLACEFRAADAELQRQMEARYGPHDELPDPIVEVTQYGSHGQPITLKWMDEEMTTEGHPPIVESIHPDKKPNDHE